MNEKRQMYYVSEGNVYELPIVQEELEASDRRIQSTIRKDIGILFEENIFALENDNCYHNF